MTWGRCLLTSVLVAAGVVGCGSGGSPRLDVGSQVVDFGTIPLEGKDLEIPLRNTGQKVLQIYRVSTSCACTVASAPKEIAAGETAKLTIRAPKGAKGPSSSRMTIESNDPAGPHEFHLSWFGQWPPQFDPPRLVREGAPGEEIEGRLNLTYPGGEPRYAVEIKKIVSSNPAFELKPLKADLLAKQGDYQVANETPVVGETPFQYRGRLPANPGALIGSVTVIASQAGSEHTLTIPIELRAVGPISYSGAFSFSAAKPDQIVGRTRELILRVGDPAKAPVVVDAPPLVRPSLREIKSESDSSRRAYLLSLEVVKRPPDALYSSAIQVQLADRAETRVAIPIHITSFP